MIDSLPLFHRIAGQSVIVLGDGDGAEAKRRLIERAGGLVVGEEDRQARLAFIALDDPAEAAERLRSRGVLVNVVDRPELCDFTVPSILDRSPVLIAIGTGGASAGLAKALRLRLEALLPQSLGRLASALGAARVQLRRRWPEAGERRRALDAALGERGPIDPLAEGSVHSLPGWLASADCGESGGIVEIHLRSDDPDDLTLREARLLGSADILAHEPGVPAVILDRARADAVRLPFATDAPPPSVSGLVIVLRVQPNKRR